MVSARGCVGGVKESSQIQTWHRTPCRGVRADPDMGFDVKFRGQVSNWRERPNLASKLGTSRNFCLEPRPSVPRESTFSFQRKMAGTTDEGVLTMELVFFLLS